MAFIMIGDESYEIDTDEGRAAAADALEAEGKEGAPAYVGEPDDPSAYEAGYQFLVFNVRGAQRVQAEAAKLAQDLYRDDLSRADEVPVQRDGHKAYDTWLESSRDAGDRDTREALERVERELFATAWARLVAG